jgi:hypothetical protein
MTDALGQTINPGDTVAYVRRRGSSLGIYKRRVHSVDEVKGVKMFDSDQPSRSWADPTNMIVIKL